MTDPFDSPELSDTGVRRREEILQASLRAARRRRSGTQFVRAGGAAAAVTLALLLVARFRIVPSAPPLQPHPPAVAIVPPPPPATPVNPPLTPNVTITRIETDPTLLARLSVPPQKQDWQVLDDDQLLQALADAGRPAGLEYAGDGQVVVLYRDTGR